MKNLIIVSFSVFILLSSCKKISDSKEITVNTKNKHQKVLDISITVDTINSNLIHILNLKNQLCLKKDTILIYPLEDSEFHNLELVDNNLFYEYASARPVYYKTIYFNKLLNTIDSIETGKFDTEKFNYNIEIKKSDINICNQKLDKILN